MTLRLMPGEVTDMRFGPLLASGNDNNDAAVPGGVDTLDENGLLFVDFGAF